MHWPLTYYCFRCLVYQATVHKCCLATIYPTYNQHAYCKPQYMHTSMSACTLSCTRVRTTTQRHTHIRTNAYIHMQVCIALKQHFGYESLPCLKAFEEHLQDLQRICWRTVSTFLWCSSCCQTVCTLWALIAALDWAWIAETTGKELWNQRALDEYKDCSLLTLFSQLNITKASLL